MGCRNVYYLGNRLAIEMSKEHTSLPLVSSVLALTIGRILGLTIKPARRHASDAADPATQPSSPDSRLAPALDERRTPEIVGGQLATAQVARRGLKLPWRADQFVRAGIWALSIFVIVVSVLTSLSRPGPTQVITSAQSLSYDLAPIPTEALPGVLVEAGPQNPSQTVQYALAYWADALGVWVPVSLHAENSPDDADETVPFMLRLENAIPGGTYTFNVRHDCANGGGYDGAGDKTPTIYDEGPGSSIADALLTTEDGNFKLWGGSFASAEGVPSAGDLCLPGQGSEAGEEYTLALTAWSETLFLLWNGHLAPDMD